MIGGLFGECGSVLDTFGLYPASRTIERGKKIRSVIIDDTKQPKPANICRKSVANLWVQYTVSLVAE